MPHYHSPFTPEQEQFIKDNCTSMYIMDIAKKFSVSHPQAYAFFRHHKLKQKKVMGVRVKAKVVKGYFNVDAKTNWAI